MTTCIGKWVVALMLCLGAQLAPAQYGPPGRIRQSDAPEAVLRDLISQVQTGAVDMAFIGPQLWQTIALQTNNTGVYLQLVQLGRVTKVEVVGRRDLPAGPLYSMTATHSGGTSTWQLGISHMTHKVEYASFGATVGTGQPQPAPAPLPPQPEPNNPPNSSEACKKFPNLCP